MAYIAMIGREIECGDLAYWFLQLAFMIFTQRYQILGADMPKRYRCRSWFCPDCRIFWRPIARYIQPVLGRC